MKLTKLQRYTAYCIMLAEYESGFHKGVCSLSYYIFDYEADADSRFTNFKIAFPELWAKRDYGKTERSIFLWDTVYDRKNALQQCINETHP